MTDVLAPLMLLPRVVEALDESNQAIATVSLGARRHAARVSNQIHTKAAHATANLESAPDLGLAAAIIEATQELPRIESAPLQALAQLHAVVGLNEPIEDRGRPRKDFSQHERLNDLVKVATSPSSAVVVGAIIHGELLSLAPFATQNGLVARAMLRATLVQRGIDPLIAVEIGLEDFGFQVLASALSQYQSGTADGVSAWIELNARALTFSAKALSEVITSKQ